MMNGNRAAVVTWHNTIRKIMFWCGASDRAIGGEAEDKSYSGGRCRLSMTFYTRCIQGVRTRASRMARM
jgi:hypothetical protein